jgi:hypothetical protein
MHTLGHKRRARLFIVWFAHLAMLAYVSQIMAFDHLHADPGDVVGLVGSSHHVMHCHGGASGCADGGGSLVSTLGDESLTPLLPAATRMADLPAADVPLEALLSQPELPPRSA